jgi:hypothetical protein
MKTHKLVALLTMLAVLALVSSKAAAQEKTAPPEDRADKSINVYRLDFVLKEIADGKVINTRSYSVVAREGETNKLRSGARYPIATGISPGVPGGPSFQYLDIGVNIDCRVVQHERYLDLNAIIDSSSISWPDNASAHSSPNQPVISQIRSETRSLVKPNTPTMISTMDDPGSKHRFQFQVTVTKAE